MLGISLIAMGEEIGAQMALRTFRHLVSGETGRGDVGERGYQRKGSL